MNNKHFKRKFLAGLCALSSVGTIAKPAIDSSTYATDIDIESNIVLNSQKIMQDTVTQIIKNFMENGHPSIGKADGGDPGYNDEASEKCRFELAEYMRNNIVPEFENQVRNLPSVVMPDVVKNSDVMKDLIVKLKSGGLFSKGLMTSSKWDINSALDNVESNLWAYSKKYYDIDRNGAISKAINESYRVGPEFRNILAEILLTNTHWIKQNPGTTALAAAGAITIPPTLISLITYYPSKFKAIAKAVVTDNARQSAQKKERKENLAKGAKNVLRLEQLTPDKLNEILIRFGEVVARYNYAPEAARVANQLLSDLMDKKTDISKPMGMLLVYGPPGSGKSSIVRSLLQVIYDVLCPGSNPLVISQSMIDEKDRVNSEARQAWGVLSKDLAGQKISSLSPFAAAVLSADKYKDGLVYVLVDDADKFKEEVLRGLWDATDGGTIHIDGKEISLSRIVFVLSANSDMSGAMDSLGGKAAKSASSAFTSRCLKFLINAPKAQDYKAKIMEMLNNIAATNGSLNISENTIDVLAQRCVKVEKGMRSVNEIRRVVLSILRSSDYNPNAEIVPVEEEQNGWLKQ